MKLEHLILGLLSLQPKTGYDIKKYLDTEWRFVRDSVHLSQLYRTLKGMQENEWVTFVGEEREGRPDTKTYSITPKGKNEFLTWLYSPLKLTFRYVDSDLSSRIAFGVMLDKKTILHFLRVELEFRLSQIAQFRNRNRYMNPELLNKDIDSDRLRYFQDLAHDLGSHGADNYVAWLRRTIEKVERDFSDDEMPFTYNTAMAY